MDVTLCEDGVRRHAPDARTKLSCHGIRVRTVECFDRCERCELRLLARVEHASLAVRDLDELVDAVNALRAPEG